MKISVRFVVICHVRACTANVSYGFLSTGFPYIREGYMYKSLPGFTGSPGTTIGMQAGGS